MECLHCKSSNQDKDFVFETEHWIAFLAPEQDYLGRFQIEVKGHKGSLSELSAEEWTDFGVLVKKYEAVIKKTFGAEMFNWTCLMNNAYQEEHPNPHVHWHVRPRYNKPIQFAGQEFTDPDFGKHYDRERRTVASDELFQKIREEIKKNL